MRRFLRGARVLLFAALPGAFLLLGACDLVEPDSLAVSVAVEDTVAEPGDPISVRVTATNRGHERVRWGPGSSSCQLDLLVRVGGRDVHAPVERPCTADFGFHVLEPGESRAETMTWTGAAQVVPRRSATVRLDPGVYELRGRAYPIGAGAPVHVRLVDGGADLARRSAPPLH